MERNQNKDKELQAGGKSGNRRELIWSIIFLIAAIVYTISPVDIIPDLLGPLGFTDDIFLWAVIVAAGLYKRFGRKPKS